MTESELEYQYENSQEFLEMVETLEHLRKEVSQGLLSVKQALQAAAVAGSRFGTRQRQRG